MHIAKGFCVYCYRIENEKIQNSHINEKLGKRGISASVSRDELEFQYEILNMSLGRTDPFDGETKLIKRCLDLPEVLNGC